MRALARPDAGGTVILVAGELDAFGVPALEEVMASAIGDGPAEVVADLGRLDFIDTSGLALLVAWTKRLRSRPGGRLVVRRPPDILLRVAEVTASMAQLEIEPSPAAPAPVAPVVDIRSARSAPR